MIISIFSTEINSYQRSDRGPATTIGDLNGDGKKMFSLAVQKQESGNLPSKS
jgi:hypothetical protein